MKLLVNMFGALVMFLVSMSAAWVLVRTLDIDWNRALLIQLLWISCLTRWHQRHQPEVDLTKTPP